MKESLVINVTGLFFIPYCCGDIFNYVIEEERRSNRELFRRDLLSSRLPRYRSQ
jgi:hypothetical protein